MKLMGISIIFIPFTFFKILQQDLQRNFANLKSKLLLDNKNQKKPVKFVTVVNV